MNLFVLFYYIRYLLLITITLKIRTMKNLFLTCFLLVAILGTVVSQEVKIPLIGSKAPSFNAQSTSGNISFPESFGKNWKILFSHPQDFTPVCTTELLELAYSQNDFDELGVKIVVVSTDNIEHHKLWKTALEELDYKGRGLQKIYFPIVDDEKYIISKKYGMLHTPASTTKDVRGVFIIDPQNNVRSINFYPMNIGRNMDEIKRIIVALQTSDNQKVSTPANWNPGDDVIVPHYPFTEQELANNPNLKDEYYNVGNRVWFKKNKK